MDWGFNPCCFGSLVRAGKWTCNLFRNSAVSILVVLDHWFGHGDGISFLDNSYWVSILVVLDHWFGRWNAIYGAAYQRLFQSLLFWIIGSGLPTRAGATTATRRFNPCCFGSLVRASWLAELQWAADVCFNPCCF